MSLQARVSVERSLPVLADRASLSGAQQSALAAHKVAHLTVRGTREVVGVDAKVDVLLDDTRLRPALALRRTIASLRGQVDSRDEVERCPLCTHMPRSRNRSAHPKGACVRQDGHRERVRLLARHNGRQRLSHARMLPLKGARKDRLAKQVGLVRRHGKTRFGGRNNTRISCRNLKSSCLHCTLSNIFCVPPILST